MKLNRAFNKSTSQNRWRISQKEPLKLDPLKQWKSQEQKPNAWELSFRRIFELVQLSNLQNGMESLTVLKSAQLKWHNTFRLHAPCTFNSCCYCMFYCHLLSIFLWARACVLTFMILLLMITKIQCLSWESLVDYGRDIMPTRCFFSDIWNVI